ncbi:MAG: hypothetical protein EXR72_06120 [Myxococcales bacterium]|nr:hypothetical protein [Myxococcales bacterium]
MPRILDLLALCAVAVVVLLPKASVTARPALDGEPMELDRIAGLQDDLYRSPDDVEPALVLSQQYLAFQRPDWALASLARFSPRGDHRVHLLLATAHAERLEPAAAVEETKRLEAVCAKPDAKCPEGALAKSALLRDAMQSLVDGKIDAAKNPVAAQEAVYKALHPTRYNLQVNVPSK